MLILQRGETENRRKTLEAQERSTNSTHMSFCLKSSCQGYSQVVTQPSTNPNNPGLTLDHSGERHLFATHVSCLSNNLQHINNLLTMGFFAPDFLATTVHVLSSSAVVEPQGGHVPPVVLQTDCSICSNLRKKQ